MKNSKMILKLLFSASAASVLIGTTTSCSIWKNKHPQNWYNWSKNAAKENAGAIVTNASDPATEWSGLAASDFEFVSNQKPIIDGDKNQVVATIHSKTKNDTATFTATYHKKNEKYIVSVWKCTVQPDSSKLMFMNFALSLNAVNLWQM